MSDFKLYDFQQADVDRFMSEGTGAGWNASAVGTGKTAISTEILNQTDPNVTIILAPPSTYDGWARAQRLQGYPLPLRRLSSHKRDEQAVLDIRSGKAGRYFTSYEFARQYSFNSLPIDAAVFDECHRFSDRKTATYQLCKGIGDNVRERGGIRMALSGTPGGNKVVGMWGVISTLWEFPHTHRYVDAAGAPIVGAHGSPNNFYGWAEHHLEEGVNIHASRNGAKVPLWGRELTPGSIVRELPLYWRHEQNFACCPYHPEGVQKDLPGRVIHNVEVDMTPTQARIYKDLEDDMMAWIDGADYPIATEGFPMQHWLRLMQVSLAVPTTELAQRWKEREDATRELVDYVKVTYPVDTKSSKLDAVDDIMRDIPYGERVLILTHSAGIIPAVLHRLQKAGIEAAGWYGAVSQGERASIKASFINNSVPQGGTGSGVQVIVAQIGAIGEGVDGLQWACSNEIWISQSANRLQNTQALGRLRRDGQKSTVNSWQIAARGTKEMEQLEKMADESAYMTSAIHAQPSFAETFLTI
jgi:superfamily II DNA or RNA helicase